MKKFEQKKQRIEIRELDKFREHRKRVFEISYTHLGGAVRYHKLFQKKINLKKYLDDPDITKEKIYVCDVL